MLFISLRSVAIHLYSFILAHSLPFPLPRSFFHLQEDKDFKDVFDMFDKVLNGDPKEQLTAESFRVVLPLLGEDIDGDQVGRQAQ